MTFTDAVVAQKVVNMRHTIRKSSLNVSFADPKGSGPKPPPPFPTDPFGMYPAHVSRVQAAVTPRYPYSGQPQAQQQAYAAALGYGAAVPRTDPVPNPTMVCMPVCKHNENICQRISEIFIDPSVFVWRIL